ncbi:Hypothetical protein I595_2901 [Croceitalea dokdonensis DOKDO 023]|uniref:Uncharacterized protein n=1 Tax=Croceitalea dokdonensis DOKDO 023 TaxID=1300341 RepID=A0A0P7A399_9FLAO|nr:Hypothetical protein I595_2901 [Croceitalea dokdonensis DOKDO 023]
MGIDPYVLQLYLSHLFLFLGKTKPNKRILIRTPTITDSLE